MSRGLAPVSRVVKNWSTDPNLRADAVFAALVAVVALVEAAEPNAELGGTGADTFGYVTIVIAATSLLFRRHFPITVLLVVTAVLAVFYARDGGEFLSLLGLSSFYAVAAHSEQRRPARMVLLTVGSGLFAVASVSILDTPGGYDVSSAVSMASFLIGASAVGLLVRNRQRLFADSEQRATIAEADRQAAAERAVARERNRIAREMHDVVAHGMSVISVQAAAAQEIVRTDPDKAAQVLGRIENVGRQSLNEMRRMLDVLRTGDDESTASLEPQPRIADIRTAVQRSTDAGIATELRITGNARELPPGIELTGYRIVQEALTNVLKHAGRSASGTVSIDYGVDDVTVEVTDDGQGAVSSLTGTGGGNGLIGMRERVEIYGGTLTAGPRTGGGFSVRAVLPASDIEGRRSALSRTHPAVDPNG